MFDYFTIGVLLVLLISVIMCIFLCKHLWDGQVEIRNDMRYLVTEAQMRAFYRENKRDE